MLHDLNIQDLLDKKLSFMNKLQLQEHEKRWSYFENLGDILLNHPVKMLSSGMYWNDLLSVFLPSLKMLEFYKSEYDTDFYINWWRESYQNRINRVPISSRNFPNREQILKEMHKYFLKVEDFMLLQKIAENSEEIIKNIQWEAMDVYKYKLSVERRYYFMVQVLTDKLFFIRALRSLQEMFTYKIVTLKKEHKYTKDMFSELFSIDGIWSYPDNGWFWRELADGNYELDKLDFDSGEGIN